VDFWRDLLKDVDCCFEVLLHADQLAQQSQFASRAAIGADGPGYPVHIDQQAVATAIDFEQVANIQLLRWSADRR
jgi:hypothetical protein